MGRPLGEVSRPSRPGVQRLGQETSPNDKAADSAVGPVRDREIHAETK